MRTTIRRMGNSHGVLIPKPMLAEIGLAPGGAIDLRVRKGRIVIAALADDARQRWAADAASLAAAGEHAAVWRAPQPEKAMS
ncbi:MAG TPA: AbrB/MazE/SpoVT family DNA-binding domain-containing protein [Xanthobacteraceae bacterium]|nr:AbrB/MazE/SpoVT family DNA-binding domain-containing protein [Xanthobacteraceae bacterium]